MARKFAKCALIALTFAVVISCCFENRVACDEAIDTDSELRRNRRDVLESYDSPQNLKLFEYLEEPKQGANAVSEVSRFIIGFAEEEDDKLVPATLNPAPKLCRQLQSELAKNVANFIQCSILNARPITVCLKCVESYNSTVYTYNQVMEASENDTKCKDVLVGKDKLEIVETMYGNVVNLWNQGNCNSCYATDGSGLSDLSVVSNQTLGFMQALEKVTACFEGIKLDESSNDTCSRCKLLYEHLGSIFDRISKDMVNNQTEVVCADITDSMNVTHHIWNNQLKCKLFGTSVGYALVILTGSLSAVPVLFYVAAKILSSVETIHLVLPKRKPFVQESSRLQM